MTTIYQPPGADIFKTTCETIVIPVNCVGITGKGLAKEFRRRFPHSAADYEQLCRGGAIRPGKCSIHLTEAGKTPITAATKLHWRDPSQITWVDMAYQHLLKLAETACIESMAVPALGCGCGELSWNEVRFCLDGHISEAAKYSALANFTLEIYPPHP